MPAFWTLAEGPPVVAFGVLVLYLSRSLLIAPAITARYIRRIEELVGVPITVVSTGADREST